MRSLFERNFTAAKHSLMPCVAAFLLIGALGVKAATPGAGVSASMLVNTRYVPPVYPEAALAARIEGAVELAFTLDTQGNVLDVSIRRSDPPGVFDDAAVAALQQWKYMPITRNGVPVEQRALIRITFKLPQAPPITQQGTTGAGNPP